MTENLLIEARERLRRLCLQLPEAAEVEAWGDPTYRIRNKIFAMEKGAGTEVWLKGAPGAQEAMVGSEPACYFVPPYVGHKGWIGARLGAIHDWGELAELIEESYRLIAPKRLAAQLDVAVPAPAEEDEIVIRPIGRVSSSLVDLDRAPNQGDEGAPDAWLHIDPRFAEGLADLHRDEEIVVLTWLDRASRDVLKVHPRGDRARPLTGVFSTRSPDRPNPIGLHRVRVLEVEGLRVHVDDLEAVDGTPVLDLKPVLRPQPER